MRQKYLTMIKITNKIMMGRCEPYVLALTLTRRTTTMWRIPSILLVLAWGLWFGGLIMLFIAVSSLFSEFPAHHEIAGQGAAHIFRIFNRYQIVLAAVTLLAAFACRPSGGSWATNVLLTALAAAVMALVWSVWLASKIEAIRLHGDTHSAEFAHLHGWSMGLSSLESLFLLAAGFVVPIVVEQRRLLRGTGGSPVNDGTPS